MGDKLISTMVFQIGEQLFGYKTKYISETVNIDKIYPVPKAKHYLKGLFNLRNSVVGIIDMGELLWDKHTESDVVVVIDKNSIQAGMLIDDVKGVANVKESEIKSIDEISLEDINRDYLESFFEYKDDIVLMIDIDKIISHRSIKSEKRADISKSNFTTTKDVKAETQNNSKGYIFFEIANEWYAMEVKSINEVITYPNTISSLPKTPEYVKGAFLLRGESVILVDLPELLGVEDRAVRNRVVLVNSNGRSIGLSIDTVRELKWIQESSVLKVDSEESAQKGVVSLENGKRLALLLDIEKVLSSMDKTKSNSKSTQKREESKVDGTTLETFVQFEVGGVSMALPIHSVNEVVEASKIKIIPKSATYLEGMMNLRNSTLVIISLSKRLDIEAKESIERVVVLDGKPVGLVVDELNGILRVDREHIFPPEESVDIQEHYLDGIIKKQDGEIVFILNRDLIIKNSEIDSLTKESNS